MSDAGKPGDPGVGAAWIEQTLVITVGDAGRLSVVAAPSTALSTILDHAATVEEADAYAKTVGMLLANAYLLAAYGATQEDLGAATHELTKAALSIHDALVRLNGEST